MKADDRIREAIANYAKRIHEDVDSHAPRLGADLAGALRAERQVWRDQHITAFTRLAHAIRQLDEALTLSDVLKALSKGAMTEASRVALLIVEADQLKVWGQFGFGESPTPTDLALGRPSPFDTAVTTRSPVSVSGPTDGAKLPFLKMPAGHSGLIVPLVVGGNVVAVMYGDGLERGPDVEEAPVWPEQIEILVRHAGQRLENLTSLRTVEVLTRTA